MNKRNTKQVRIDKQLHRQLKHRATETEKTITRLANQMIIYCIANNVHFNDEISTIEIQ